MRKNYSIRYRTAGEYRFLSTYKIDYDENGYYVVGIDHKGTPVKTYEWMESTNIRIANELVYEQDEIAATYRNKQVSGTVIFDDLCGCYVLHNKDKFYPLYMCKDLAFAPVGEESDKKSIKKSEKKELNVKCGDIMGAIQKVVIYTDGSCLKNPGGAGGYAGILVADGKELTRVSGGECESTNNRMELLAAIKSLEALSPYNIKQITLYSDSQYVVNPFVKGWLKNWKKKGWNTTTGEVKNKELWMQLDMLAQQYDIEWNWVKGHNGNHYNELCDQIARKSAEQYE